MLNHAYPVKIFATTGTAKLAEEISEELRKILPLEYRPEDGRILGRVNFEEFSNENFQAQLIDNVRGHFVIVVHTQVPPVHNGLFELFGILDAIKNAQAADILLVFPYMPYVRSDRKNKPRISVMAHRLADIISNSFRIRRVLLMDPHDSHVKHYFEPAADEITAINLVGDYLERKFFSIHPKQDCVMVFADAGAAKKYGTLAHDLQIASAYIDKDRPDDMENPEIKKVVGSVDGRVCILIDDEILTGKTSVQDAETLIKEGALEVHAFAIHGILNNKKTSWEAVIKKIDESPIRTVVVTDSIPVRHKIDSNPKFVVLSVVKLLAHAIGNAVQGGSLSALHERKNVDLYRGT